MIIPRTKHVGYLFIDFFLLISSLEEGITNIFSKDQPLCCSAAPVLVEGPFFQALYPHLTQNLLMQNPPRSVRARSASSFTFKTNIDKVA